MNDQIDSMKMPREVAVELLSGPKVQLSNRMRKTCFAALERPVEVDGAAGFSSGRSKLAGRSMAQLARWHKRAVARYNVAARRAQQATKPEIQKAFTTLCTVLQNMQDKLAVEILHRTKPPTINLV